MGRLTEKTAIVTAAGQGIGKATALVITWQVSSCRNEEKQLT